MDGGFEDTEVSHVEEAQEIDDLTAGIRRSRGAEAAGVNARFRHILEKYQEQSQLLDPHLPLVISRLSAVLQQQAHLPVKDQDRGSVTAVCRLLWITASVRGPGVVLKLFPNEARDLEPITCLLHDLDTPEPGEPGRGVWEATCVLLLWLAQLVLVPFSLRLLDSSLGSGKPGEEPPVPPLVGGLLQLCQGKLGAPGKERDMAALLLGRLLPRPDMPEALRSFLSWSRTAVDAARPEAAFLTPGVTATLAEVYKQGGRPQLLAIAPQVWQLLLGLLDSEAARNSVTSRKLAVKLLQRLGLAYLPPRATRWRYTTSATSLEASLGPGMPKEQSAVQPEESGDEDDEVDVSEEVEEVLGKLLEALGDKDTVVRWSAAKGVSRLTARLPKELGDEVAGSVLAVFGSPGGGEASWHGGCLALAELARRGLLLPARLPEAAAVVRQGLLYDVRRGMNSVGANVRDAAAYVCWACARAYEPALLRATLLQLAPTLLVAACCDREVNCRRAAAAAFQEAVGRQDSYPHGIDILTAADYFSLSTRTQAYLSVAPTIAAFPEHFHPLLDHLLLAKLRHWERSLRQLASRGLAVLLPIKPPHFVGSCIPTLLHLSLEPSLEVHHGAVLGLAEVILALHTLNQQQQQQQQLTEDQISSIAELPSKLHAAMYLKGKGGEVMKAAISRLVECMALASIPLSESQQKLVHDTIDDCLAASSEEIRAAAVAALRAFSRSYLLPQLAVQSSASSANGNTRHSFIIPAAGSAAPSNGATASGGQAVLQRSVQKYAAGVQLAGQLAAVRSSYAAALGCLPRGLLVPHQAEVLSVLGAAIQVEEDAGSRDAAARAAAATALSDVAQEVLSPQSVSQAEMIQQVESSSEAVRVLTERVAQPLMVGMADYSTDNRGDVGSWVREAAMRALTHTLLLLLSVVRPGDSPHVQPGDTSVVQPDDSQHVQRWMVAVTCVLIKQAVERIGRVREAAAVCLRQLLTAAPPLPGIPARALLQRLILQAPTEGFASREALPGMVELLGEEATREALLEGLIASIGGLDGSLAHASSSSLIAWLKADDSGEAARRLRSVITALLAIWSRNVTSARLAVPLLKTLDLLLSQGGLDTLPGPHVGALLAAVVQGTQGCRDVARLCTAAGVLTQMAVLPHNDSAPIQALQAVLKTLTCTFPRVRKHAAEQLYMALLAADPSEPPFNDESQAADLEAASAILADTAWDGPLAAAKEASRQLHGSLGCAPA